MKTARYHCSHCDRRFESEEREIVECPGCFWSTSVAKDNGLKNKDPQVPSSSARMPDQNKASIFTRAAFYKDSLRWKPFAIFFALGVVLFLFYHFKGPEKLKQITTRTGHLIPKLPEQPAKIKPAFEAPNPAALSNVTRQDQSVLSRDISENLSGEFTAEEKTALEKEVSLKTGLVERLPSAAWTLDGFEKMLEEEEKKYKISFPRSYRNKLMDLFKAKYLPAAKAFQEDNLLLARDGWVQSLAFPLYSPDLRKHRGVALTILRPLINDTLSKIAALNNLLRMKALHHRELELNQEYEKFHKAIQDQKWQQAFEIGKKLEENLLNYERSASQAASIPPYPAELSQVDQDIAFTLNQLLSAPDPSIADVGTILQDVREKQRLISGRVSASLSDQVQAYKNALLAIQSQDYSKAAQELKEIKFPSDLVIDAAEKLKILEKLQNQSLDSAAKQG